MLHVRVMASMVVAAVGAHLRLSKSIVLPLGIIDTEQSRKPMAGTGLHVVVVALVLLLAYCGGSPCSGSGRPRSAALVCPLQSLPYSPFPVVSLAWQ